MKVNQSVVANQETKLNQDGKPVELWGEGDYEIPRETLKPREYVTEPRRLFT